MSSQRDRIDIESNTQKIQALFGLVEQLSNEVDELRIKVTRLEQGKRGPGRPRKDENVVHLGT